MKVKFLEAYAATMVQFLRQRMIQILFLLKPIMNHYKCVHLKLNYSVAVEMGQCTMFLTTFIVTISHVKYLL